MKLTLKILRFVTLFLFLVACNPLLKEAGSPIQPTLAKTRQANISTSTSTITPTPIFTPQPARTRALTPTETFTPWPTKEVLAQFGIFGGDGGWIDAAFSGSVIPKWVLYTDGQLIVKKEDGNGFWLEETTLTVSQRCAFLSQIEKSGFSPLKSTILLNQNIQQIIRFTPSLILSRTA